MKHRARRNQPIVTGFILKRTNARGLTDADACEVQKPLQLSGPAEIWRTKVTEGARHQFRVHTHIQREGWSDSCPTSALPPAQRCLLARCRCLHNVPAHAPVRAHTHQFVRTGTNSCAAGAAFASSLQAQIRMPQVVPMSTSARCAADLAAAVRAARGTRMLCEQSGYADLDNSVLPDNQGEAIVPSSPGLEDV
eukprot:6187742-Pleurochrysis_carterae.AAC.1